MNTVTADTFRSSAGPNQSEDGHSAKAWTSACTPGCSSREENRRKVDTIVEAGAYIMGRNMFGPGPR